MTFNGNPKALAVRLVQIVPELSGSGGGVGDFAFHLATGLCQRGIQTTFIVPDRSRPAAQWAALQQVHEASVCPKSARVLVQQLEALCPDAVLLHYSGYGYARRGAPLWLNRGLRQWRTRNHGPRLAVMFHELWALGPPWTSSFWMFPLQRSVAARLLRLADVFLTNTDLHARRLRRLSAARAPVAVLPVVSNVGETDHPTPFEAREPLALVFGASGTRERLYACIEEFLPAMLSAGIEGIVDVGPPIERRLIARAPLPVTSHGYLESESAAGVMMRARLGLLDYPLSLAAKSGILAAYAAHGLIPVVRSRALGVHDRLQPGVNVLLTSERPPDLMRADVAQEMASAAYRWYQDHHVMRSTARFAEAVCPVQENA